MATDVESSSLDFNKRVRQSPEVYYYRLHKFECKPLNPAEIKS